MFLFLKAQQVNNSSYLRDDAQISAQINSCNCTAMSQGCPSKGEDSSSGGFSENELYWPALLGTRLAQVFNVRIKHNDDVEKFEVYGTVSVVHSMGTLHIYDKQADDSECVSQGGTLSLLTISNDMRVIYATRGFTVHVDLKEKDANEFIKGSFNVSHCDIKFSIPGKFEVREVQGIRGVATIYYAPLKVATPFGITAQIQLNRSVTSDQPVEVYGCLMAWYGKRFRYGEDEEYRRIKLFDKKREEAVKVHQDEVGTWNILLKTSHLAAPLYTPLVIQADFWCVCADGHEERFEDQFEMPPNYIQMMRHKIERNPGQLQVWVSRGPVMKLILKGENKPSKRS